MQNQHKSTIKTFKLDQTEEWLKELTDTGAVVIKNVLSQEEVQKSIDLIWEWIEAIGTGVKRGQPDTWDQQNWPGMKSLGFFATYGGCHTKASWFIRCNKSVRSVFAKIWKTQKLITSFDTFIGWKPWWVNPKWKPRVQNLHCDQNPFVKRGLKCVQGMIPLKRVRENQVGGLMVVPHTNNDKTQDQLISRYPATKFNDSDWVELFDDDPFVKNKAGQLVECDAGDMILWDSRTIHGGKVCQPSEQFKSQNKNDFVRLSMTVTMVPREWAPPNVIDKRIKAFEDKVGLTHWPHEFHKSGMGGYLAGITTTQIEYDWPKLQGQIKQLVGY